MPKRRTAKKPLGVNPFQSAKQAAPMKLLSLDPSARPPDAKPKGETARRRPAFDQGRRVPTRGRSDSRVAAARPAEPTSDIEPEAPRRPPAFAQMETELSARLRRKEALPLNNSQMQWIDDLVRKIENAELPEPHAGLARRLAKAWSFFTMFGRSMAVDDFGRDPRFEELVSPLLDFMFTRWWRVDVSGLENVPATGRALIVSNHSGMLPYDGGMIKHGIRKLHPAHREVRPLVEDFVWHFPFLGALMARIGGVRACQENAQRLLEKDELVAVFPEGVKGIAKHYRYRYQLQRFGRGGFVRLCLRTGAPIIPTAVVGAEEIHPIVGRADWLGRPLKIPVVPLTPTWPLLGPLGMVPFPTKWSIHFGRPIDLHKYGKAALDDDMLINKITADVRTQIQELIYEQLKKRRSVFFG